MRRTSEEQRDLVGVHDPQPAGIRRFRGGNDARSVWRCHIHTSQPNADVWSFLRAELDGYDAAVLTLEDFGPPGPFHHRLEIIPPAIDPLSPKNVPLDE